MSQMKFKEAVKKLYVRGIYGGHFGFYVENICSTQYSLVYFKKITPGRHSSRRSTYWSIVYTLSHDMVSYFSSGTDIV